MDQKQEITIPQPIANPDEINALTQKIIGCAIEVHKCLGSGLPRGSYQSALCVECDAQAVQNRRPAAIPSCCRAKLIGEHRIDLLVENRVVVELQSVERMDPIFEAQVLTYLKISGKKIRLLLININSRLLKHGIPRFAL